MWLFKHKNLQYAPSMFQISTWWLTCHRCWYMEIIHHMHDLHITGGSTLCWYYLSNWKLWDWYNNSWLWLSTWNIILSYLLFETRCFRYERFCWILLFSLLLSSFLFFFLHECGSRWVLLENLQFPILQCCSYVIHKIIISPFFVFISFHFLCNKLCSYITENVLCYMFYPYMSLSICVKFRSFDLEALIVQISTQVWHA